MQTPKIRIRDASLMFLAGLLALASAFASAKLAHQIAGDQHQRTAMTALALTD
ncbi:MAG: hypothetical protein ACFB0F_00320 [Neomegalonema sp.]